MKYWFLLLFLLAAICGWVMNVMALIQSDFTHITGMTVVRILGVFPVAPLGAVMGYF